MKFLLIIALVFFSQSCLAQAGSEALYNFTIPYRPASIKIFTDTSSFPSSVVNGVQKTIYTNIKPGRYKIQVSGSGQVPIVKDSLIVREGQKLVLHFRIDGPCLYDHPTGYIPVCPKHHKDNIIPVVYGLIVEKVGLFIKDKKDLKVKYAGCVTTGCDPQFYCKEHGIEF